jgi:hypothetical protein
LRIQDTQTKDATRIKRLALKLNWYFHTSFTGFKLKLYF